MEFILTTYKLINSKKNNKQYLTYTLLLDKRYVCECVQEYSEMFEQFLKNYLMQDVSEYVNLTYVANIKALRPYVKYN